ncbi:MAG TPA: adenylate/guanylate cyclase domain-containing protein [Candidatus Limnocylindria bacterium]|nr:adenylate/guanylate cyclase domain-containing protein [Candidatus Limnocylindria bacterium]
MTDDTRTGAASAAYRGFLFSDLRGFTAFAERHGNTAAAAMVGRFLEITRRTIARHQGAEIKTEGDAIHAVFPSASSAVMCGLEIVDATEELNARDPGRPIGLGVGVHAGEAIETAEGYIGTAVNMAARLCAAARPGEVLVSSTVKGITQASIPVGFIPRGRRRLKGIRDAVEVFAVVRDTAPHPRREMRRPAMIGAAGIAAVAAAAIVAVFGSQLLANLGAGSGATPGATAGSVRLLNVGPLDIGSYHSRFFDPGFKFDVSAGWAAEQDAPEILRLVREGPATRIDLLRVQEVIGNPCIEGGEGGPNGPGPGDLIRQLQGLGHLTLSETQTVRIGGSIGSQVDVSVADGALMACGGPIGGGASILRAGGEVWSAAPGERFRLTVVGVGNKAVTIIVSTDWTTTPSVSTLESVLGAGRRVVDTVSFVP